MAIKTLLLHDQELQNAAFRSRFRGEAQAAGRLSDPNIVSVFDYGETPDFTYIVMEYVEGTSLDTRLVPGQALPLAKAAMIMEGCSPGCSTATIAAASIAISNRPISSSPAADGSRSPSSASPTSIAAA